MKITYNPKETGILRAIVDVTVEGNTFMKHLDINATAVEYMKFIIDENGNELSRVDFNEVFFGQKSELKGYIVNNSPEKFNFRVNFLYGLHQNYDENSYLQTPLEAGLEQTMRVMTIEPSSGTVAAYSKISLSFKCKSKVQDDHVIWTRNYCMAKDAEHIDMLDAVHQYTALFNFDNGEEPKVILMTSKSICPMLRFSTTLLDFGECQVHERKDLRIWAENKHNDKTLLLKCPNVSHFFVTPEKLKFGPGESKELNITFKPKNMGRFNLNCDFIINQSFNVSFKFVGQTSGVGPKSKKVRGLHATCENFREEPNYIPDNPELYKNKRNMKMINNLHMTTGESNLPEIYHKSNVSEKLDAFQLMKFNKRKYNDYLTSARQDRVKKKDKTYVAGQKREIEEKIKLYQPKNPNASNSKDDEDINFRPVDIGPLYNENKDGMDSPRVEIPHKPDTLFVTKPIHNYEPYDVTTTGAKFIPDTQTAFKEFPAYPSSHSEIRNCNLELTGEQLQKIQVGPTLIDFSSIFMKSKVSQYFQVKNELRNSIMVRIDAPFDELSGTYQDPQVIPSGKVAGFKIELCSSERQTFTQTINYIINEKHYFKLKVNADVIPVNLTMSKTQMKFIFSDDNYDMETTETIKIENGGNSKASFSWVQKEDSVFSISPTSGEVNPHDFLQCQFTFMPSGNKHVEEENIELDVKDGNRQTLKCIGYVSDVKCDFQQAQVNFGTIAVSQKATETVFLKNSQPRSFAIFKVDQNRLPDGVEIKP